MKMMRSIIERRKNKKIVKEWKETNLKNRENYVKNNFKSDKMKYGLRKSQFSQKRLFQKLQNNLDLLLIIVD
jgi:hypothetical protein